MPVSPDINPASTGPDWAQGVLESLYSAAFATPDREVAGVLVGVPAGNSDVPTVRAIIPAGEGYQPGQASMFGHETWTYVHQAMARHYDSLEVVGWYVSRAGLGTDLVDADVLNHQRWFARPDQVVLVFDSRSHRAAIYTWGTDRALVRAHEGPVARRYTRPPRTGSPIAALVLLAVLGAAIGAIAFLLTQTL